MYLKRPLAGPEPRRPHHGRRYLGLAGWLGGLLLASACQAPPPPPPLQRLITEVRGLEFGDAISRAQRAEMQASGSVRFGWEFDGSGAEKDWSVLVDVKRVRRVDGQLHGLVTGDDPSTTASVRVSTARTDSVWLRVSSERGGVGQLFWATKEDPVMTEKKSLTFVVPLSANPADQVLAVGTHPDWTGKLINLRVDMPPMSGEFKIDFIRIIGLPSRAPSVVPELRGRVGKAVIKGEVCLARFSYPPDEFSWEVESGQGSSLRFSYGLLPEAWLLAASSVRFSVTATPLPGGEARTVFLAELRPRTVEADRSWHWSEVPLGGFKAGKLRLTFSTVGAREEDDPGRAPGAFAYAVWGNPEMVTPPREGARNRPSIILIAIDAARADRIGAYGYARGTTPTIDAFASGATVFEHATSQASWSLPSYASLFTSLYPSMVGVTQISDVVPQDAPTLAGLLREAGYQTAAFTGGGFAGREWGMDRGFDLFWEGPDPEEQVKRLVKWLVRRPSRPFLLYLHTFEAHDFLFQRQDHVKEAARLVGRELHLPADVYRSMIYESGARLDAEQMTEVGVLYDGALRVADRLFARFLEILKGSGALENAVVVLFADHGEAFKEHGIVHHGLGVYEELIHVPLIVRTYPAPEKSGRPRRVRDAVELIDVLPTFLELAGVPPPGHVQGRSLAGYVLGRPGRPLPGRANAEAFSEGAPVFYTRAAGGMKYIYVDVSAASHEQAPSLRHLCLAGEARSPLYCEQLFDLEADPGEDTNLASSEPQELAQARDGMLAAFLRNTPGLRVLARGGASKATLGIRLRNPAGPVAPRVLFAESPDLEKPGRIRLDRGDFDLVSWDAIPDAALPEIALEFSVEGAGGPLDVRLGPTCASRPRGGSVVSGRELLSSLGSPLQLPPAVRNPSVCVFLTPRRTASPETWRPSAETVERLRALGYLE